MQPHHHLTGGAVLAKETPSAFMLRPSNKLYLVGAPEAHVPESLQVPAEADLGKTANSWLPAGGRSLQQSRSIGIPERK
jgi:hypothetical protein